MFGPYCSFSRISASSSAMRAMSVQVSTAADWITSHQTEAPPVSR
jgi:hypothetical protein